MTIMSGSMKEGRHGAGAVTESFHSDPQAGGRESGTRLGWAFETSKFNLNDTPPPSRPHLLTLPKQSTNW